MIIVLVFYPVMKWIHLTTYLALFLFIDTIHLTSTLQLIFEDYVQIVHWLQTLCRYCYKSSRCTPQQYNYVNLLLVDIVINHLYPHLNKTAMWICCLCFSPCTGCWQRWRGRKRSETWWTTRSSSRGTIEPRQWWRGTREPIGRGTSPASSGCGQRGWCSSCCLHPTGVKPWLFSVNCDNVCDSESYL